MHRRTLWVLLWAPTKVTVSFFFFFRPFVFVSKKCSKIFKKMSKIFFSFFLFWGLIFREFKKKKKKKEDTKRDSPFLCSIIQKTDEGRRRL